MLIDGFPSRGFVSMWEFLPSHREMRVVVHQGDEYTGELFSLYECERYEGPICTSETSPISVGRTQGGLLELRSEQVRILFKSLRRVGVLMDVVLKGETRLRSSE